MIQIVANLWERVRSSFWFVPLLMTALSFPAAFLLLYLDSRLHSADMAPEWAFTGEGDEARALLSTIAASVATIAGVVFSITIVVLTLASSQFGPQVLRQFMRDLRNQFVLGAFAGTFVFCILVLRGVGRGDEVPSVSVTAAILLGVLSFSVLIYFLHHISSSIQSTNLLDKVGRGLVATLKAVYPPRSPDCREDESPQALSTRGGGAQVRWHDANGYFQALGADELVEIGQRCDLQIRMECRPGDFLVRDAPIATVWPAEALTEDVARSIQSRIAAGPARTQAEDVEFAIDQIVQAVLRALSPSLNDPHTARTGIDHLAAALVAMTSRVVPSPLLNDSEGTPRVLLDVTSFTGLTKAAFNEIRQNLGSQVGVAVRLAESLAAIALHVRTAEQHDAILAQLEMLEWSATRMEMHPSDRRDFERRLPGVRGALARSPFRSGEKKAA